MEPVIYYVHEGSDNRHYTIDSLAFVLNQVDDNTVDLVIFPVGGPVKFERVSRFFPSEDGPTPVGGTYWRAQSEDPPDFDSVYAESVEATEESPEEEGRPDA